jgi:hypothetical protein
MKVKDMIEQLQRFAPDAEVRYYFPLHNHARQVVAMRVSGVELRLIESAKRAGGSDTLIPQSEESDHLHSAREVVTIL